MDVSMLPTKPGINVSSARYLASPWSGAQSWKDLRLSEVWEDGTKQTFPFYPGAPSVRLRGTSVERTEMEDRHHVP